VLQRSKRSLSSGKVEDMQREVKAFQAKVRGWAAEVPTASAVYLGLDPLNSSLDLMARILNGERDGKGFERRQRAIGTGVQRFCLWPWTMGCRMTGVPPIKAPVGFSAGDPKPTPPDVRVAMASAQLRVAAKYGDFDLFVRARRSLRAIDPLQLDLFIVRSRDAGGRNS
jgi:hypothetical protein